MDTLQFTEKISSLLSVSDVSDYSDNGLQVHASKNLEKIAFAVDGSLSSFERAASLKADLLIVHHGLFWGRSAMLSGYMGERVRFLFENRLSLYAVHLPLDAHETLGNSAALIQLSGAETTGWFAKEKGLQLGCLGELEETVSWKIFRDRMDSAFGCKPLAAVGEPDPETPIRTVGSVTGGGMRFALEAKSAGADVFISGEPSHAWYHPVLESGIPCLLYGHYATETLGLQRLKEYCDKTFELETVFIEDPTGM